MKFVVDLSRLSPEMVQNFKILCRAWEIGLTVELEDETTQAASLDDLIDVRLRRTFVYQGQNMMVLAADSFGDGEVFLCAPADCAFEFGKQELFKCEEGQLGVWVKVDNAELRTVMIGDWHLDFKEAQYRQV